MGTLEHQQFIHVGIWLSSKMKYKIMVSFLTIFLILGCCTGSQDKINETSNEFKLRNIIPQFDAYAGDTFNRSTVPGMAIAIVSGDKVIYQKCFGVRKAGFSDPVDNETVFPLASISKSFTSATIASLVGDGVLSWDDKVTDRYPGFKLYDPCATEQMTLRDLLCHRSGLPEYAGDELADPFECNNSEVIYHLRFLKPVAGFRAAYAYQNALVMAAAEAAGKSAGMEWEDLVAEKIFKPLGMRSSSSRCADFEKAKDRVESHVLANGTMKPNNFSFAGVLSASGGVSSNINDMAKYAIMQLSSGEFNGKKIISSDALNETHKPHTLIGLSNNSMTAYGLGWEVRSADGRIELFHGGDLDVGISTLVKLFPSDRVGIVVLTNAFREGHILKFALTKTFEDLYFKGEIMADRWAEVEEEVKKAMAGPSILDPYEHLPPAPANATPALPLASYTGEYRNDYYGTIKIVQKGDQLQVYTGRSKDPRNLTHWDRDIFRDEAMGSMNEPINAAAIFTIGSDGKAFQVLMKAFDFNGRNGTFTRNALNSSST
jgi:CubicO group peptidase (beta-lactamase class C family)